MLDYVTLIQHIKKQYGYDNNTCCENTRTQVIAFGGGYGGMLASWLRMKYPTHFNGAIASGAPMLWFKGAVDPNRLTVIASQALRKQYGEECWAYQSQGLYDLAQA